MQPPTKKVIAKHIDSILNNENIEHTVEDIVLLIKKFYPDFRKIINNCQKYTVNGVLKLENLSGVDNGYQEKVLGELVKPTSSSLINIRQIIANSDIEDFTDLYRYLYDNLSKYSRNNDGELIIIIEESMYRSQSVFLDKEINIMATISKILQIIKTNKII